MQRQDHPTGPMPPAPPHQSTAAAPPYPPQQVPEPERPKWSTRKTTAVTAVAAAAVLAVGGVAVANSGGSDSGTSQGPGGGQFGGPGGGFDSGAAGLAGALHGTFVTESDGSYVTRQMQAGEVTAVGSTSITVTSADGYTKTYSLSSSTTVNAGQSQLSAIKTGHTVTVIASGSGAATTITDRSLAGSGQNGPSGFPGGAPGQGPTGQDSTGTTT